MTRLRRLVAVGLAAGALAGAPAVAAGTTPVPGTPSAVIARTCSSGYTHAVIGGAEKCLRRGQYCAKAYKSQYPRYGFKCVPTSTGWRLK